MLILFVKWRHPRDLKHEDQTWWDAYEGQLEDIPPEHRSIIHNLNVLSECKDARDKATHVRKLSDVYLARTFYRESSPDPALFLNATDRSTGQEQHTNNCEPDIQEQKEVGLLDIMDSLISLPARNAVDHCYFQCGTGSNHEDYGHAEIIRSNQRVVAEEQHTVMRTLKRKRRPDRNEDTELELQWPRHRGQDRNSPRMAVMSLPESTPSTSSQLLSSSVDLNGVIRQVILEKKLDSNAEQQRAFEIIARHVCFGGDQLQMFIAGVGGTGKSYVVESVIRLFTLLGRRDEILVGAPTGTAAILIGGYTVHSLTLLPDHKGRDIQELIRIWKNVKYFIVDEVSMLSAVFLCQLSCRLQQAKGETNSPEDIPYGGVNMVFTGDFAQLRPVKGSPLYSHRLLKNPEMSLAQHTTGVNALKGVYLWRLVNSVVILRKNHRQHEDPTYADILSRIRIGECAAALRNGTANDNAILQSRLLHRLHISDPIYSATFQDAPIIVGRKRIRDILNIRIIAHHARNSGADVHIYHSRDRIAGATPSNDELDRLWTLSSSQTHDSLGRLPLFPGMKIMVQENLVFSAHVVNGMPGTVRDILYEEEDGRRYPIVVYVHIPQSGKLFQALQEDIVPIFPESTYFTWYPSSNPEDAVTVTRSQLPLLPAYAYTDYKAQGRSLEKAIVDPASALSLQGVYVMLSRVKRMDGLAILRHFPERKINDRLSQELREELARLEDLDRETSVRYEQDPIQYS